MLRVMDNPIRTKQGFAHATGLGHRNGTLTRIRERLDSISGTARQIADVVLANPEKAAYSTITDLAKRSNVSQSAVVRFCRQFGYAGYQEFRIALAQDIVDLVSVELEAISDEDDVATMARKIAATHTRAIESTLDLLDAAALKDAATAISRAGRISIHAAGPSRAVAIDVLSRFMRVGLPVVHHSELHAQMIEAGHLQRGDVAIGVSHSGSSIGTVEPLRAAREQGATTICITRFADTPLTEVSDIVLYAASQSLPQAVKRVSRPAMLLVSETLFALVTRELSAPHSKAMERSRVAIHRLRDAAMYDNTEEVE